MIKRLVTLAFGILLLDQAKGQATVQDQNGTILINRNQSIEDISKNLKRGSFEGGHLLGDSVAMALNSFERVYTYFVPGHGAYALEEKKVIKPVIYEKIHILDRYYTKAAKKGTGVSLEAMRKNYHAILSTATELISFDTKKLEDDIRGIKNPSELEAMFLRIKIKKP